MNKSSKIYIAGHKGMVGSAILKRLEKDGYDNILTRTHKELDLTRQKEVEKFFYMEMPEYVFLAAARVGGIVANRENKPSFLYDNIMIAMNVIHSSYLSGVKKLINLGSSCIYPRMAPQPLKEEYLLSGPLEETNDAYAIAKISAIKMCHYYNQKHGTNYLSVMPTNLYGYNDNYDLINSHVLAAMVRKFHEAKQKNTDVVLWGDGSPMREFLFADDLADAVVFLMEKKDACDIGEFVNVGTGKDITIKELANLITSIIGFDGTVHWDSSKPNGTPRKLLDISRLTLLGWRYQVELKDGLRKVYDDYLLREKE